MPKKTLTLYKLILMIKQLYLLAMTQTYLMILLIELSLLIMAN